MRVDEIFNTTSRRFGTTRNRRFYRPSEAPVPLPALVPIKPCCGTSEIHRKSSRKRSKSGGNDCNRSSLFPFETSFSPEADFSLCSLAVTLKVDEVERRYMVKETQFCGLQHGQPAHPSSLRYFGRTRLLTIQTLTKAALHGNGTSYVHV